MNMFKKLSLLLPLMLLSCLPSRAQLNISGSITTSAGSNVAITMNTASCVGIVITGAWTGSLAAQQSNDGVSWQPADMLQQLVGKWTESASVDGRYYSGGYAANQFRLLGPTTTGTANIVLQTSPGPCNLYTFAIPGAQAGNGFTAQPVSATSTQTTFPDGIQGENSADVSLIWASITGTPSGCLLQPQGSPDGVNYINSGPAYPIVPGTNAIIAVPGPFGLAVQYVYSCGTYPTGGTITLKATYKPTPVTGQSKCPKVVPITVAAAGTQQVIAPVAGQKFQVCALVLEVGTAGTLTLEEGTGATCGTGTTNISGTMTMALGAAPATGAASPIFTANVAGDGFCIVSGTAAVAGFASVGQY